MSLFALFTLATFGLSVYADTVQQGGALIHLRIEGATETIFDGPIFTTGHNVTTASGGTHHCDGTNNNQNPTPGPTCTSALDDAAAAHGFTWDGTFFDSFDDYLVTRIASDSETSTEFWSLLLNYQLTTVGGCQQQVQNTDEVLFAFDALSKAYALKLEGPTNATANQPLQLTVVDGSTGTPVANAEVGGQTSDGEGHVWLTFGSAGSQSVKAEKSDSIRSRSLVIDVAPGL
ncbi:hypothetical protein AMATHDRAFT_951 [Amanita thiersii Skay4041]|uniref:Uncharacterized protein n=1 Tax=Amanita thiersii Skay4041 TaxID=703135 RepID=A0A2A9NYX5_9AGAR|nr:hypothetical protein AMATHDRAFT_951 [Amanita thiersii Skay4041]